MDEAVAARLDALEMRVAHQDRALDELNAALTAQWATIDRLTRQAALLQERVREAEARAADATPGEPPPPHY